jgi:BirA family biotin operon repressor/biotin-[acetyl-CoA-carboxylase] ligase
MYAPLFTLACAVSLHNAVEKVTRVNADIKWPNDLLAEGKKVAGILADIHADMDRIHYLVVGTGINVNHEAFPEDLRDRATSLRLVSGHSHSRLEILVEFLEQYENLTHRFVSTGPEVVVSEWTRHSSFACDRRVEIADGLRVVAGITRGLNAFGALRVETALGRTEELYGGEVRKWE